MADTAARMLALLGLLQSRADWSGAELAERLGVTDRTVRNDIERLRGLGYPVDAVRGPGGRYRLGVGTKLPPLLLEEDEAVAVAVGLRAGATIRGIEETSARALAKLEHVLPHRLQRRVNALKEAVTAGPENTGSNVDDPVVDAGLLAEVAGAIRDREELRFDYRDARHQVEPYRLVSWQRRWYVVARDARDDTWAPYRLDWVELKRPGGRRFAAHPLPGEDYTGVRAARGGVLRVERARADRGRRARRRRARQDQPDRRRGRERGRRALRARHRRRQRRAGGGVHRDARAGLPRLRAARAGVRCGRARRAVPTGRGRVGRRPSAPCPSWVSCCARRRAPARWP